MYVRNEVIVSTLYGTKHAMVTETIGFFPGVYICEAIYWNWY